jgi:hypothetical protein
MFDEIYCFIELLDSADEVTRLCGTWRIFEFVRADSLVGKSNC